MATFIIVVILVLFILSAIKVVAEYDRLVVFRLGRLLPKMAGRR